MGVLARASVTSRDFKHMMEYPQHPRPASVISASEDGRLSGLVCASITQIENPANCLKSDEVRCMCPFAYTVDIDSLDATSEVSTSEVLRGSRNLMVLPFSQSSCAAKCKVVVCGLLLNRLCELYPAVQ
eukprot:2357196-Amphidinium_carterae.1